MKPKFYNKVCAGICLAIVVLVSSHSTLAQSTLVTVTENPDQVNSSLSNTDVFTFDNLSLGYNNNVRWNNVGTFDQLYVLRPSQWGGAPDASSPNGTNYSVQGVGKLAKTTLSLDTPSSYFGLWWSAGDSSNLLRFYNSDTLLAEFRTNTLTGLLPKDYYGNPINRKKASHEPFAFVNFYGDEETQWDRIEFTNATRSGFESDNYTSRVYTYDPNTDGEANVGNVVAEVSGNETTEVSEVPTDWSWGSGGAAPGAPAPPVFLAAAFAVVVFLKNKFKRDQKN
ncbi:MAG: hypothetical protein AAF558_03580 [Verrucomicrobiota bacterium]